jgi:hypothetical protein
MARAMGDEAGFEPAGAWAEAWSPPFNPTALPAPAPPPQRPSMADTLAATFGDRATMPAPVRAAYGKLQAFGL